SGAAGLAFLIKVRDDFSKRKPSPRARLQEKSSLTLFTRSPPPGAGSPKAAGATMTATMSSVLGIFGGTFDPVHCGHLELAREVRAALRLAAVRFIPAGDPPHRAAPVAPALHRLAMVELAIADHPGLEVDAREIQRRGRSYTVESLEELRGELPLRALALIVGADAFLG